MAGQVWSVNTSGGYMYALNLSRELRMAVQPIVKFRQFCDIKDAAHQGLNRGDTFHWNVFSDVATQSHDPFQSHPEFFREFLQEQQLLQQRYLHQRTHTNRIYR